MILLVYGSLLWYLFPYLLKICIPALTNLHGDYMAKKLKDLFKKSNAVTIPDSAKTEIPPREQEAIDKEYTQLCISIGDRYVKSQGLEEELGQMLNYARRLGSESAKRQ